MMSRCGVCGEPAALAVEIDIEDGVIAGRLCWSCASDMQANLSRIEDVPDEEWTRSARSSPSSARTAADARAAETMKGWKP